MAARFALVLALAIGACRRPDRAPSPPPPVDARVAAVPPAPAPPSCGPVFPEEDAVEVPAGTSEAPLRVEAVCGDRTLAVAWRAAGVTGWAIHPLRDGARWAAGTWTVPPVVRGGAPYMGGGALWSAVIGRDEGLSLLRAPPEGEVVRVTPLAAQAREWFNPRVLWVEGSRALLAIEMRRSGFAREAWLLALGGGALSWSPLGAGTIATSSAGERALVVRLVRAPEGLASLRGRWIDARAALRAMTGGRVALGAQALGVEAEVPLPHAGMEFAPRATDEGVVFYQAVIGAERGAAGVAEFPREGAARGEALLMAPGALGDVVGEGDAYTLHWWDERYVPRRRTVRGARVVGESEGAPPAGSAFGALEAARVTRHLGCDGAPWVVRAEGGRLRARREDCPAR